MEAEAVEAAGGVEGGATATDGAVLWEGCVRRLVHEPSIDRTERAGAGC